MFNSGVQPGKLRLQTQRKGVQPDGPRQDVREDKKVLSKSRL